MDSPEIYYHKKQKFPLQTWNRELLFFQTQKVLHMVNFVFRSKSEVFQKERNLCTCTSVFHTAKSNTSIFLLSRLHYISFGWKSQTVYLKNCIVGKCHVDLFGDTGSFSHHLWTHSGNKEMQITNLFTQMFTYWLIFLSDYILTANNEASFFT